MQLVTTGPPTSSMESRRQRSRGHETLAWHGDSELLYEQNTVEGDECAQPQPSHLMVLVHGLHGHSNDLRYICESLEQRLGLSHVLLLNVTCNEGRTEDGIDSGGARVAREIQKVVHAHPTLKTIAFVCHSLGGLYARYALSILNQDSSQVPPKHEGHGHVLGLCTLLYASLATPHLGSRQQCRVFGQRLAEFMFPTLLGTTGEQLLLLDGSGHQRKRCREIDNRLDRPLLLRMAEDDAFMVPLRNFVHLHCYANVWYDSSVHYCTSAIRKRNGFHRAHPKPIVGGWCSMARILPDVADEPVIVAENETPTVEHNTPLSPQAVFVRMHSSLICLPWRRWVVMGRPLLAHTDIVVKWPRFNRFGRSVVEHLLDNAILEAYPQHCS